MPIILIVAAIGLFVAYINPTYQNTKVLSAQAANYNDALTKSQELRQVRDQLLQKSATFSADDVNKLSEVLPSNVDNIRLVIDINNIASRHNLTLNDVGLGSVNSDGNQNALASGNTNGPIGSVQLSFTVNTPDYQTMLAFLEDLEHSLRIIDVEKLGFTANPSGPTSYSFTIQTYWLQS